MEDLRSLRAQAAAARKTGRAEAALALYRRIWFEFPEDRNGWDGWGYARCYYQQRDYARALRILVEARALAADLPALKSLQAWCLYHLHLKQDPLPAQAEAVAEEILALSAADDAYGPWQRTVFRMLNHFRQPFDPRKTLAWLAYLDPRTLSREPEQLVEGGRTRSLPSPWLRYTGRHTEALLQLGEFAGCEALCREVLEQTAKTVPAGQRIWFERRLGRCLSAQGQPGQAAGIYRQLLLRKQEWFLYHELAECLLAADERLEALRAAAAAALAPGESEKKVRLWLLLAELLDAAGKPEQGLKHRLLCALLRRQQGWSLSPELFGLLEVTQPLPTTRQLLTELRSGWQEFANEEKASAQRVKGRIEKLLPHGQAGFIRLESGQSVYFRRQEFKGDKAGLKEGTPVSCELADGFDAKKQKPSRQAIQIRRAAP